MRSGERKWDGPTSTGILLLGRDRLDLPLIKTSPVCERSMRIPMIPPAAGHLYRNVEMRIKVSLCAVRMNCFFSPDL